MEEWSIRNFEILTLSPDEAEARTRALARLILKAAQNKPVLARKTRLRRSQGRANIPPSPTEKSR